MTDTRLTRTRAESTKKNVLTKQAQKDAHHLVASGLKPEVEQLLKVLGSDSLQNQPRVEKLIGDLRGAFSRRINLQHRLIYQVIEDLSTVKVLRMWTHYE